MYLSGYLQSLLILRQKLDWFQLADDVILDLVRVEEGAGQGRVELMFGAGHLAITVVHTHCLRLCAHEKLYS